MSAQSLLWNGFLLVGTAYLVTVHDWSPLTFLMLAFLWQTEDRP